MKIFYGILALCLVGLVSFLFIYDIFTEDPNSNLSCQYDEIKNVSILIYNRDADIFKVVNGNICF